MRANDDFEKFLGIEEVTIDFIVASIFYSHNLI